ncbi:hypothetical protein DRO54_04590 [Candidatus Bathyarchaeota archaeon]|nr:MAG: hypothetical protein DRO54_04590 [Candidatus Bathyarchaeota archaeon]
MKAFNVGIRAETLKKKSKSLVKAIILLAFSISLPLMSLLPKSRFINGNFIAYTSAFNFLYILTLFPLKGNFTRKFGVLILGDLLSFIWNSIYPLFLFPFLHENNMLSRLFWFINPIVNAVWIISMWSLGLSLIAPFKVEETAN